MLTMRFMVNAYFYLPGTLGHTVLVRRGWGVGSRDRIPVVSHGVAPCLRDWPSKKSPNSEAQMSFPGWPHFVHIVTHGRWEN